VYPASFPFNDNTAYPVNWIVVFLIGLLKSWTMFLFHLRAKRLYAVVPKKICLFVVRECTIKYTIKYTIHSHYTRSSNDLHIIFARKIACVRSINPLAQKRWNSPPDDLKKCSSKMIFKKRFKTVLLASYNV